MSDDEIDNEQSDDDVTNSFKNAYDRLIFLIDANLFDSKVHTSQSSRNYLLDSLNVALKVLKSKIISDEKSSVGVIFYGSKVSDPNEKNLFSFIPLEPPSASNIRKLQSLVENITDFEKIVGISEEEFVPLREALYFCSHTFYKKKSSTKNIDCHRIWIFTNNDNPKIKEISRTMQMAKDCREKDIELSLWYIGETFDTGKLYENLLVDENNRDDLPYHLQKGSTSSGFESLFDIIRRKEKKKKILTTLPVIFSAETENTPSIKFSVQLFHLFDVAKKATPIKIHSETNLPVRTITKLLNSKTGTTLSDSQISQYIAFGGKKVDTSNITKANHPSINIIPNISIGSTHKTEPSSCINTPAITILFFTDNTVQDRINSIDLSYFLFPEVKVKGSSVIFSALLHELFDKNLVAVVKFVKNTNSVAKLGIIIPQMEEIDENGLQIIPPGFHMLIGPFLDDIRANPSIIDLQSLKLFENEASIKVATEFIDNFTFDKSFNHLTEINNPAIQQFYSALQAIALVENRVDWDSSNDNMKPCINFEDGAISSKRDISRFDNYCEYFKLSVEEPIVTKKAKVEIKVDGSWVNLNDEELSKLTNDQLKGICQSLGVSSTGVKKVLVERISANRNKVL